MNRASAILFLVALHSACGILPGVSKKRVRDDLAVLVGEKCRGARPENITVYPGEGDFDNSYMHARFTVAMTGSEDECEWLKDALVEGGSQLRYYELLLLYQHQDGGSWVLSFAEPRKTSAEQAK